MSNKANNEPQIEANYLSITFGILATIIAVTNIIIAIYEIRRYRNRMHCYKKDEK